MGSMAFWYEKSSSAHTDELTPRAVMNFNLWTQCSSQLKPWDIIRKNKSPRSNPQSFLDIGFIIYNITAAKKLYYYIPFKVSISNAEISDLSKQIQSSKTIGAIFNETLSVIDEPGSRYFWPVKDASISENPLKFVLYQWDDDSVVTVNSALSDEGTCLEIDVEKFKNKIASAVHAGMSISEKDPYYFRFRVNIPSPSQNNTIVRRYKPPNNFLQSTLITTYIIDFRLNDTRSLSNKINDQIKHPNNALVDISKLHFLLMTKAHIDVETGEKNISLRELESNTWDDYIDHKFEIKDIVAFHCSEKPKDGKTLVSAQWEFFAKLKCNNSTFRVIFTYFIALLIITIILDGISGFFWKSAVPFIKQLWSSLCGLLPH